MRRNDIGSTLPPQRRRPVAGDPSSSRNDDFGNAVFRQKLTEPRPLAEQVLNDSICECPLNGERLGHLHFNGAAIGDVEAAMRRLFGLLSRMKEGEHLAAWIQRRVQMADPRGYKGF